MNEPDVMVYLMTGFLDSGKSQFLKFTLTQDYFQIDGTTLLILCEEGEEEFDPLEMAKHGVKIIKIEEQEELTEAFLNELHEKYSPERVVIEYNGMWKVSDFEAFKSSARMGNRTETDNSGCKYISDVSEQPEAVVCRNGTRGGTGAV